MPGGIQSCLSVFIGSMREAREAGIHAASRHAAMITIRLEAYATGSVTCTISLINAPAGVARDWKGSGAGPSMPDT